MQWNVPLVSKSHGFTCMENKLTKAVSICDISIQVKSPYTSPHSTERTFVLKLESNFCIVFWLGGGGLINYHDQLDHISLYWYTNKKTCEKRKSTRNMKYWYQLCRGLTSAAEKNHPLSSPYKKKPETIESDISMRSSFFFLVKTSEIGKNKKPKRKKGNSQGYKDGDTNIEVNDIHSETMTNSNDNPTSSKTQISSWKPITSEIKPE